MHAVVATIDELRVLYHYAMCIDHCCITTDEVVEECDLVNLVCSERLR